MPDPEAGNRTRKEGLGPGAMQSMVEATRDQPPLRRRWIGIVEHAAHHQVRSGQGIADQIDGVSLRQRLGSPLLNLCMIGLP